MFISRKEFERKIGYMGTEIDAMKHRYYALRDRHDALLRHLQLREVQVPAQSKIEEI